MKKVMFPTVFNHIHLEDFKGNEQKISDTLKKYLGKFVLVKDTHNSSDEIQYKLGQITDVGCITYHFTQLGHKEPKKFHYYDLEELIVPTIAQADVKIKI